MGGLQHLDSLIELSQLHAEDRQEYWLIVQFEQCVVWVFLFKRFKSLFSFLCFSTQTQRNKCDLTVQAIGEPP